MVALTAGAVVLVPFPFSDLSEAKLRPALALAEAGRGDWILRQITSDPYGDTRAVPLVEAGFASGSLRRESSARPGKLFTADRDLVVGQVAALRPESRGRIIEAVVAILRGGGAA